MKSKSRGDRWFEEISDTNPEKGVLISVILMSPFLLICLPILVFFGVTYAEEHQIVKLIVVFLFLVAFIGFLVMIRPIATLVERGSRTAGMVGGILLIVSGCGATILTFSKVKPWMESLEGSAIKIGPIVIPGVLLVLMIPIAGLIFAMKGIAVISRSLRGKKWAYRQLRKAMRKRK